MASPMPIEAPAWLFVSCIPLGRDVVVYTLTNNTTFDKGAMRTSSVLYCLSMEEKWSPVCGTGSTRTLYEPENCLRTVN